MTTQDTTRAALAAALADPMAPVERLSTAIVDLTGLSVRCNPTRGIWTIGEHVRLQWDEAARLFWYRSLYDRRVHGLATFDEALAAAGVPLRAESGGLRPSHDTPEDADPAAIVAAARMAPDLVPAPGEVVRHDVVDGSLVTLWSHASVSPAPAPSAPAPGEAARVAIMARLRAHRMTDAPAPGEGEGTDEDPGRPVDVAFARATLRLHLSLDDGDALADEIAALRARVAELERDAIVTGGDLAAALADVTILDHYRMDLAASEARCDRLVAVVRAEERLEQVVAHSEPPEWQALRSFDDGPIEGWRCSGCGSERDHDEEMGGPEPCQCEVAAKRALADAEAARAALQPGDVPEPAGGGERP